jgi:DHA1 family bicyclomycin/chloramphenicol resistance-like MFS transporter
MNSLQPTAARLHRDRYLVFVLAALTALGPLSTDAYLPALPAVAESLDRTIHDVELSISLFLIGLASGQIIGGPLSDHFGRRAGIQTGLLLFLLATGLITIVTSIEGLWVFRALQGIGAGIAVVNVPAIIRDLYSGRQGAKILSEAAMIMMVTPIISPSLGLLVTQVFSWRAIFVILAVYACLLSLVIFSRLPETRQLSSDRISAARRYWLVLRKPRALAYLLSVGCVYGSLFAYVTASPWLYIEYFAVNEKLYPLIFEPAPAPASSSPSQLALAPPPALTHSHSHPQIHYFDSCSGTD